MEELYKVTRVSAKELADFMGISTRTLTRMDENGTLPAYRSAGGNRIYTTEHIRMALEIMASSRAREVEVRFLKKGSSLLRGRVEVPRRWLEKIGVTQDNPKAKVCFDGEKIIISRAASGGGAKAQKVENDS